MLILRLASLLLGSLACVTAAHAADLMKTPVTAEVMVAPATDWAGAYVGGRIGYGNSVVSASNHPDFNVSGLSAGGQLGYNFDLGNDIIAGVQADADWSNASGNDNIALTARENWMASLTAHLGLSGNVVMPYVLGGVAFVNTTGTWTSFGSDTQTSVGWTAGVGAEAMLADKVSGFLEYRYTSYSPTSFTVAGVSTPQNETSNSVRGGLNFHF